MSPILFSLFFDRAAQYITTHFPGSSRLRCPHLISLAICILLYADDVVLLSDRPSRLRQLLTTFGSYCDANGLRVGSDKSKVILVGCAADDVDFVC